MKIFLAALLLIGIGVLGMCFNVIFRGRSFPQYEVGSNKQMREMGIRCLKEEEDEIWGGKAAHKGAHSHSGCSGQYTDECTSCALYPDKKA